MFVYLCVCMYVRAGWFDAPLCVLCAIMMMMMMLCRLVCAPVCVCECCVCVCPKLFLCQVVCLACVCVLCLASVARNMFRCLAQVVRASPRPSRPVPPGHLGQQSTRQRHAPPSRGARPAPWSAALWPAWPAAARVLQHPDHQFDGELFGGQLGRGHPSPHRAIG